MQSLLDFQNDTTESSPLKLQIFWLARPGESDDPAGVLVDRFIDGRLFADRLKDAMDEVFDLWSAIFEAKGRAVEMVDSYERVAVKVGELLEALLVEDTPLQPQQRSAALQLVVNWHFTLNYIFYRVLAPQYGTPAAVGFQETLVRGVGGKVEIPVEFKIPFAFREDGQSVLKTGDRPAGAALPTGKGYHRIPRGVRIDSSSDVDAKDLANLYRTTRRAAERVLEEARVEMRKRLVERGLTPDDMHDI